MSESSVSALRARQQPKERRGKTKKHSKAMRDLVKALISAQNWTLDTFAQLGGRPDDDITGVDGTVSRDEALRILGLTIDKAVDKWLAEFSTRMRQWNDDAPARAAARGKALPPDPRRRYVETSTDPFTGNIRDISGRDRHSALIFMEYQDHIRGEEGIDVFETNAQMAANNAALRRMLKQFRRDKTFADESILDEVEKEILRDSGVLTKEEQQAKDEYTLSRARTAKDELRLSGMSDAPRLGFCKRTGCPNRKVERLLVRGFCPDCRGLNVKQRIAKGSTRADATAPDSADATAKETKTSIKVSANRKKVHPDVFKPTTEERREKVLAAKKENTSASVREIAKLTNIPRATVNDILTKAQIGKDKTKT